jgi:hypothetical protein
MHMPFFRHGFWMLRLRNRYLREKINDFFSYPLSLLVSSFTIPRFFGPFFLLLIFTPGKKREGKIWFGYFRFLRIKKPAISATATMTAANIIAISVVISGASDGSVGSGSMGPPGDVASSTPIAVSEYELK